MGEELEAGARTIESLNNKLTETEELRGKNVSLEENLLAREHQLQDSFQWRSSLS